MVHRSQTKASECVLVHAAAAVCNALSTTVTSKTSLRSFKASLKTHLVVTAYTILIHGSICCNYFQFLLVLTNIFKLECFATESTNVFI